MALAVFFWFSRRLFKGVERTAGHPMQSVPKGRDNGEFSGKLESPHESACEWHGGSQLENALPFRQQPINRSNLISFGQRSLQSNQQVTSSKNKLIR
jgi:hypothetical protein